MHIVVVVVIGVMVLQLALPGMMRYENYAIIGRLPREYRGPYIDLSSSK